jgi:hypothetical protein
MIPRRMLTTTGKTKNDRRAAPAPTDDGDETMNLNGRSLLMGFIAGALSVVVFHQGMVLILHFMKLVPNFPWNMATFRGGPVPIPVIVNQMFWGGMWGAGFAAVVGLIPVAHNILRGVVYGLLGPGLLGNGILVPLFKGGAFLWGFQGQRIMISALIASAFGAGLAVFYRFLAKR